MKTYISVGIGDAVCLDSILTQEERDRITEVYWACRFGSKVALLLEDNPCYPNIKSQHFLSDKIGREAMRGLDPSAENFWHFRPDFPRNRDVGLRLFNLSPDGVNFIDAAAAFLSGRTFTNSSFVQNAKISDVDWNLFGFQPKEYSLFHYPTSSRPRSDIAKIGIEDINTAFGMSGGKLIVVSDCDIVLPHGAILLKNASIKSLIALVKYCDSYWGCDSFLSIAAARALCPDKLHIKSHNPNIQTDILSHRWLQKFYLPHSPQEISNFYKNYL